MTAALILGFVLLLVALFVVLPALVYRDARRLEMEEPSKWAAITLFTAGAGVVLYFFERDDAKHGADEADPFALPNTSNAAEPTSKTDETGEPDETE